jgi:hypothetical protein
MGAHRVPTPDGITEAITKGTFSKLEELCLTRSMAHRHSKLTTGYFIFGSSQTGTVEEETP